MEASDLDYQRRVLPDVSRTFALTIPELPGGLGDVVANGYLLCRIADTIEDEPLLEVAEKRRLHLHFADAVEGRADAEEFAHRAAERLSDGTAAPERELVRRSAAILRVTNGFEEGQRAALARCVRIMCEGMSRFQGGPRGLADVGELRAYCYHVAGCVGEMLTDLFCAHSPEIEARRAELEARTVSFGHGLQMTNILKDVWDDLARGFCWLPRDVFERRGLDLARLRPGARLDGDAPAFQDGLRELVGIAHGHLRDALEYTLQIPSQETGIRHFCLWALGMAVLTLRKIHRHLDFSSSREVKITRRSVRATVLVANLATRSDRALRLLFAACAAPLPEPRRSA